MADCQPSGPRLIPARAGWQSWFHFPALPVGPPGTKKEVALMDDAAAARLDTSLSHLRVAGATGTIPAAMDGEQFKACGLPADPPPEARAAFEMAATLLNRGEYPAAAVALACAAGLGGSRNVQSLPFGYDGPRIEHERWLRREDLAL